MKPFRSIILLTTIAITAILSLPIKAQTTIRDSQGIVYNILTEPSGDQPGTCAVGSNTNFKGDAVIPYSVTRGSSTYVVTQISNYAFEGSSPNPNTSLTSIDLSTCTALTSIGQSAFKYCTALISIDLSNCAALRSIGSSAFYNCSALSYLDLSACTTLTLISESAFNQSVSLSSVNLSGCISLTTIGSSAFYLCSALKTIDLSNCAALTSIGIEAFRSCTALTSIDLSNCTALTNIGARAFSTCSALKTFTISSLEWWWNVNLYDYTSSPMNNDADLYAEGQKVTHVTVPSGRENLGWHLTGCTSLEYVDFAAPQEITSIEDCAFRHCFALTEIDFSRLTNITSIGFGAFVRCSSLTSIDLSACTALTSINSDFNNQAFAGCSSLTSIDLSGCTALTSIGNLAFYSCTALTSIDLSNCTELTEIGHSAFSSCTALNSAFLPESLQTVGSVLFDGCSNLSSVTSYAPIPPTGATSTIFSTPMTTTGTLYVPACSVDAYNAAQYWNGAANIMPIGSVSTLSLSSSSLEFNTDWEPQTLTLSYTPENSPVPAIEWTLNEQGVAELITDSANPLSVSVKPIKPGVVTLTAKVVPTDGVDCWNDLDIAEISCEITVTTAEPVTTINLSLTDFSMAEGAEPVLITATLEPEEATFPQLDWTLSQDNIVEIIPNSDPDNTLSISIKPLAPGEITLTATAQDGSDVTASCNITVVKLTGVEIGSTGSGDGSGNDPDDPNNPGGGDGGDSGDGGDTGDDGGNTGGGDDTGSGSWGSIMTDGATLHVGESLQLEVRTTPSVDFAPAVTWTTAESSIASVTPDADNSLNATLLGVAIGKTTLTISAGDLTSTANITVIAENPITSLSILPQSVELAQNADPFTFEAQIEPADATVKALLWKSDDTSVATVDQNGTVTPVGQGECIITATTTDGTELSATATVTVTSPVSTDFDFDLSDLGAGLESLTLQIGESYQLKPKASEPDAVLPENISWSSSNPQIASVSGDGTVTALAFGQTKITASAIVNGQEVSASCTVNVIVPLAKTLSISPSQLTLDDGAEETLTAEFTPADAEPNLVWTSSDANVVSVVAGLTDLTATVFTYRPGTATITVKANDGSGLSATCTVTVVAVPVKQLSLGIEDLTIDVQDSPITLNVTVEPAEATLPELKWESSDPAVATVSAFGNLSATLTPLKAGTTTVKVSHADDPSIFDSALITVTDKSSIGDIFTDGTFEEGPVDVYDLSGRMLKRQASEYELQDLRPGIYIFRQGNTSRKILIH